MGEELVRRLDIAGGDRVVDVACGTGNAAIPTNGRLGLCAWTPEGVFGEFFRIVADYLPEDPEFADPPLAWGDDVRVRRHEDRDDGRSRQRQAPPTTASIHGKDVYGSVH